MKKMIVSLLLLGISQALAGHEGPQAFLSQPRKVVAEVVVRQDLQSGGGASVRKVSLFDDGEVVRFEGEKLTSVATLSDGTLQTILARLDAVVPGKLPAPSPSSCAGGSRTFWNIYPKGKKLVLQRHLGCAIEKLNTAGVDDALEALVILNELAHF